MPKRIVIAVAFVVVTIVCKSWLGSLPGPGSLTGVTWQLTELTTRPGLDYTRTTVLDPEHYTLHFYDDGTVQFIADCNRSLWTFTQDGGSIELRSHAVQWSTCGPDSHAQQFVDVLWRTNHYSVWFGQLVLEGQRGICFIGCESYRLSFRIG